jgi:hypothetical protein
MSKIANTRSRKRRPFAAIAALAALLALALVAPAGADVDLRSPDARDAATPQVDLRSPDAREAARGAAATQVDLRSPDARDAGRAIPAAASPAPEPSGGFGWGYVVIGGLGVLLIALLGVTRLRRGRLERAAAGVTAQPST